jgi:hypothetical protein
MPYTITNRQGTLTPIIIQDGTINSDLYLNLPGPNFVGYGSYLNQNLISLLENFAGPTAPSGHVPLDGQLWYNTNTKNLNVYSQSSGGFVNVSDVIISGLQPTYPKNGQLWFNTSTNQLSLYNQEINSWNLIGPLYTKSQGQSGAIPVTVADASTSGLYHNIIQIQYGGTIMAILSSDQTFSPSPAIPGFPFINPGITLNNYNGSEEFTGNIIGNIYGNVSAHRIVSDGYFFANGDNILTYSNSNVASYLAAGTDGTLLNINSSISGANASIVTINNALVSNINTVNTSIISNVNAIYANTGSLQNQISTISDPSTGTVATNYLASIHYSNTLNTAMVANVNAANLSIAALAFSTQSSISTVNSNVNAVNANISTANLAMKSYVDSVTTSWIANAASQQININSLQNSATYANSAIINLQANVYSNANVNSYLTQGTNTITANRITANIVTATAITNNAGNITITPSTTGAVVIGSLLRLFSTDAVNASLFLSQVAKPGDLIFNTTYNKFQGFIANTINPSSPGVWANITLG